MLRLRVIMAALSVFLPACELIEPEDDGPKYKLTAISRSASTLQLQWDNMGSNRYTVDFFSIYTDCEFPPTHPNQHEVTGTSVTLTGLTAATQYQIHVHDLPDYKESSNLILVRTLEAGAQTQPIAATDYTSCD